MKLMLDIDDTLAATNLYCWEKLTASRIFTDHEIAALKDQTRGYIYRAGEVDQRVQSWLSENLIKESFLLDIQAVPDAVEAILHLTQAGWKVKGYITSRFSSLHETTLKWLQLYHFPEAPVFDRPHDLTDPYWKLKALSTHDDQHELVFIDNEIHVPEHLTFSGKILQIDPHQYSPYSHPSVTRFEHWADLVRALGAA